MTKTTEISPELRAQILINLPQAHKPLSENDLLKLVEELLLRIYVLEVNVSSLMAG